MFRKTIFLDSVGLCRLFQQLVGYVYFLIAFRNSKFLNDHPKVLSQVSILKVSRKREVIFVFGFNFSFQIRHHKEASDGVE